MEEHKNPEFEEALPLTPGEDPAQALAGEQTLAQLWEEAADPELDALLGEEPPAEAELDALLGEETPAEAELDAFLGEEAPAEAELDALLEEEIPAEAELDTLPAGEEETPQPEPAPVPRQPQRKGRPKRRKGEFLFGLPALAATAVWLVIIVLVGTTLGRMLWAAAADVLAFGRQDKAVTITVYQTDTIEDITEKLHKGGLIRYPGLFQLYASLAVDEGEIKPGIWDLNTLYDYHALVNMMSGSSTREVVEITIPEGYTCRQIFALLEEHKVATAQDLALWAANGELNDYWFLEGVERGEENCLEGFLFPDTYEFYKNDSPRNALQRMLNNFENRFTDEMRGQIDTLNATVTDGSFTLRDIVIVASMIEKEAANTEECATIASVIYNRLFDWGGTPAYLNIDASIVYAQNGNADTIDTSIDSPYNTYRHTGLTPGPIANPGLASLKGALNPDTTDYFYYVLNPATGTHQFSTTLAEHEGWIDQFRGN